MYSSCSRSATMSQSLWVRDRFLILFFYISTRRNLSQSLWVRDRFLMRRELKQNYRYLSQSLWVRDRFLIVHRNPSLPHKNVAIPLGQGQVFNGRRCGRRRWSGSQSLWVRDRFLIEELKSLFSTLQSQSLWVRDRFLIPAHGGSESTRRVAIPLGQGQVFNSFP